MPFMDVFADAIADVFEAIEGVFDGGRGVDETRCVAANFEASESSFSFNCCMPASFVDASCTAQFEFFGGCDGVGFTFGGFTFDTEAVVGTGNEQSSASLATSRSVVMRLGNPSCARSQSF